MGREKYLANFGRRQGRVSWHNKTLVGGGVVLGGVCLFVLFLLGGGGLVLFLQNLHRNKHLLFSW